MNSIFVKKCNGSIVTTQSAQPQAIAEFAKAHRDKDNAILGYAVSLLPVFNYENLPEDIKQTVLARYQDFNVDGDEWYESIFENWQERLAQQGFENAKLSFSGFYSQGDGASFTAMVNLETFLKKYRLGNTYRSALMAAKKSLVRIELYKNSNSYCHEYTMSIRLECYSYDNEKASVQLDNLASLILNQARQYAKELYANLKEEYHYLTSENAIKEAMQTNEYCFTSDGKIFS